MKFGKTRSKVYETSTIVIVCAVLLTYLVCNWPLVVIGAALLASLVIGSPAAISMYVMCRLSQKRNLEKSFAWMLLLAFIPLLSFVAAWLRADFVPGKVWLLLLLGMLSGFVGILSHGISVTQSFN